MKICHMTSVHNSKDDRIFLREASAAAQEGYDTYIVAPGKSEVIEDVHIEGIGNWKVSRLQRMVVITKKIYQKALEIDADIYQFHDPELLPLGKKLKRKGKIVIYDSHEDVPRQILAKEWIPVVVRKIVSKMYEVYEKNTAREFDFVVAATPHISKIFQEAGVKTKVVKNYPLLKDLHGDNSNYKERDRVICYAGGLTEQRGITTLVKVMKYVDAKLILAGDIEKEYLKEIKELEGIEKVELRGFLDRKAVEQMYGESRIGMAVLKNTPNHVNALAIKLFEYMASGIPIICSDFPLWKEIVEKNGCGICVDPENEEEIRQKIVYLLDNQHVAKQMGDCGKKVVHEKFNWDKEKESLLKVYGDFVKRD